MVRYSCRMTTRRDPLYAGSRYPPGLIGYAAWLYFRFPLMFDPEIRPQEIRPQEIRAKRQRARSAWFRQGECLRRIHDELRNAAQPLTTRDLAERLMRAKAVPASDERSRELIQKTVLGSLNRAKETIARVEVAGVVSWRLI